ncbi:hypothetical protein E2C01_091861 [Portunus trituberculatus]|uniref:Uncharacterized protein n=1 Tax=Portunus trituberculatus TaxID=210409 RepID=A0A5B7JPU1_PORTR|nr:hypothetical protein [Portunus trituberculatus]
MSLFKQANAEEFGRLQMSCDILTIARAKTASGEIDQVRNNSNFHLFFSRRTPLQEFLLVTVSREVGKVMFGCSMEVPAHFVECRHENPLAGEYSHHKKSPTNSSGLGCVLTSEYNSVPVTGARAPLSNNDLCYSEQS